MATASSPRCSTVLERLDPSADWIGLGLSGGTSMDGIDCALVRFPGGAEGPPMPELLAWQTAPMGQLDRERIDLLGQGDLGLVAAGNLWLGTMFGMAGRQLLQAHPQFSAQFAACGGQTVAHLGKQGTLQLGAGAAIAELVKLPVVSDFRSGDVAAGGEGAPLAPFLDWVLFRDQPGTAALNIGGMSNLTLVAADPNKVSAFDSGPGNALIDRCARWASEGAQAYDAGGELAAAGRIDEALLAWLMTHPYLASKPPKSTGLEAFGDDYFAEIRAHAPELAATDLAATLCAFTARSIAGALAHLPSPPSRIVVTGGGAHNPVLISMLAAALDPIPLAPYPAPRWIDAKEAVLWALLGHEMLRGRAANLPAATGARGRRILGSLTLPPP